MPTIKIKGSSTAAAEPLTLAERELAVNVTDKKLYVGDGAAVQKIVGSLGNQEASAVAITGGSIAGITDLAVADGGTGASTAADARTNLGITATGADTTYAFRSNNLSDLASASTARTNLGLGSIATQASSSVSITGGSITGVTDIAIADGGTGASTAADARTNLGLGSIATQSASSVAITGGTISGITDLAVADGGTGASTAADARTNLSVPSTTGSGASGTWGIDISGNAATATSATSATTATNLAGGAANRVPYQSASGTTTFVAAPTVTNSYLKWNGTALGWDTVSGGGGGGGTPGGSDTQVQFNDGGSFGGDAGLTYDKTTDVLTVAGSFNGPVGATTANTGAFTTLSASSTVSGAGFSTYLASPPAIGGTAAAAGSFTTLSASSTVSGTGFSTYLASPPAIGGTAAAAGTFTTLTANGNTTLGDATTDTITLTGTVQPGVVISGSSSGDALRITQTGAGNALLVEDDTNPDSTPFVVNASGNVGIGTSSPAGKLGVDGFGVFGNQASTGTGGTFRIVPYGGDVYLQTGQNTSSGSTSNLIFTTMDGAAEHMRINSSGNLGLGVTPSAWYGNMKAVQFSDTASYISSYTSSITSYQHMFLGNNGYMDSTGAWLYSKSRPAAQYYQQDNTHKWLIAASGTAGNAISFTQAMTLDASGNLGVGVGTSSPSYRLHVAAAAGVQGFFKATAAGSSYIRIDESAGTLQSILGTDASEGFCGMLSNHDFVFRTNNTVRVRIGSGGEVYFPGVGTTASAANAYLNNGSTPANQLLRSTSSLRYKTDVETLDHAKADAVLNLRPVWYRSKAEADRKDWSWYGLIAEEVAQVEPRLVHWSYPEDQFETIETQTEIEKTREVEVTPAVLDDEGNVVEPAVTETETYTENETKSERKLKADAQLAPDGVQYDRLTVMLLDIVKRQNQRIEQLEAKVAALEAQ